MDFFSPSIAPLAAKAAWDTVTSGWLSEGPRVKELEHELENIGLKNAVCVSSGTAALHLALELAGVEGQDVILPAQTFIATGMAVLMARARPVFVDIELNTGNISVEAIKECINFSTRAIIPVHWGGLPCDLFEINQLAREWGAEVIEDAAHALGATYMGRPIGAISDYTAFSFQSTKHLTTGDGGALCCINEGDAKRARSTRWFGIPKDSPVNELGEREYDVAELGFKYNMNDVAASIGLANLKRFHDDLIQRQITGNWYRGQLEGVAGVNLLESKSDRTHAYWIFTILVERRPDFIRKMKERGIPVSVVHQRIDKNDIFQRGAPYDLPNQELFDECQISLPCHPNLTQRDLMLIADTIKEGW